jgi:hypothetical protein
MMMSDRLRARLRALDRPEEPSPAFRESLYQQLARRADIAAPSDLPWTAPVAAPVKVRAASGRRRWLPLLVAATVATSLAGGLAALSALPRGQACEPALAQSLAEAAPGIDYTYTAEGTIQARIIEDGRLRIEGQHAAPDRIHERYLEGEMIASLFYGAEESVRIGSENWLARADLDQDRYWSTEKEFFDVAGPSLAYLPSDRVTYLLQGSTKLATVVDWAASPAPDGGCRLTGTIVPSPTSPARRILKVEVARNATLPTMIREEWVDYLTPDGEWEHDVTWHFMPSDEPPTIEPPAPESVLPPFDFTPEDIEEFRPRPRATLDAAGSVVVDLDVDDPDRGEILVTVLEIREDTAYGEVVAYPGTSFLAINMRQEGIQFTEGSAGSLGWYAFPADGGMLGMARPLEAEGPGPRLNSSRVLRTGESLEGWMHVVVPNTGGLDAYWRADGGFSSPALGIRLRPHPVIGSGVVDGVAWEAIAYQDYGRLCTMVRDTPGEDSDVSGSCGPAVVPEPGIVFASMSGEPLMAHGVTSREVTSVRLETTAGNVDVAVSSLASLGVSSGAFAVAVPAGSEVRFFVALDEDGNEIGRAVGPAATPDE